MPAPASRSADFVTPKWLAARLGVTPGTVVRWCAGGRIEATRTPGGRWLIRRSVAERVMDPSDVPQRRAAGVAGDGSSDAPCRTSPESLEILRRAGIG